MNWRERTPQQGGGKGGAERKGPSSGAGILSLVLKAPSEDTEKPSWASTGPWACREDGTLCYKATIHLWVLALQYWTTSFSADGTQRNPSYLPRDLPHKPSTSIIAVFPWQIPRDVKFNSLLPAFPPKRPWLCLQRQSEATKASPSSSYKILSVHNSQTVRATVLPAFAQLLP